MTRKLLSLPEIGGVRWEPAEIRVRRERAPEVIGGWTHPAFPGLAVHVHCAKEELYAITHVATGLMVLWLERHRWRLIPKALELMTAAGDWTLTGRALEADPVTRGAMYRATVAAHRLFANDVNAAGTSALTEAALSE